MPATITYIVNHTCREAIAVDKHGALLEYICTAASQLQWDLHKDMVFVASQRSHGYPVFNMQGKRLADEETESETDDDEVDASEADASEADDDESESEEELDDDESEEELDDDESETDDDDDDESETDDGGDSEELDDDDDESETDDNTPCSRATCRRSARIQKRRRIQ